MGVANHVNAQQRTEGFSISVGIRSPADKKIRNHDLIAQNQRDSAEAESLAEHMDEPWYAMTSQEQERMRGLSVDLYALREGGPKRIQMPPEQVDSWRQAAKRIYAKYESGDVDSALSFLRKPVPETIPPQTIPMLQAMAWQRLGDLETALVFMEPVKL